MRRTNLRADKGCFHLHRCAPMSDSFRALAPRGAGCYAFSGALQLVASSWHLSARMQHAARHCSPLQSCETETHTLELRALHTAVVLSTRVSAGGRVGGGFARSGAFPLLDHVTPPADLFPVTCGLFPVACGLFGHIADLRHVLRISCFCPPTYLFGKWEHAISLLRDQRAQAVAQFRLLAFASRFVQSPVAFALP